MKRELSKFGGILKHMMEAILQGKHFWFFPKPSMVMVKKDQNKLNR
jgi:hypothetical protein